MLTNITEEIQNFTNIFKSPSEVKNYLVDYRKDCKDKYHKEYLEAYDDYIQAASKSFQVPYAFLACLIFKESQFNKDALSTVGATGLSQAMKGTIDFISGILKTYTKKDYGIDNLKEDISEWEEIENSKGKAITKREKQMEEDARLAKLRLGLFDLAKQWKIYIQNLKQTEAFNDRYNHSPSGAFYKTSTGQSGTAIWKGEIPTYLDKQRVKIPPIAVGLAGFYSHYTIKLFKKELGENSVKGEDQMLTLLALASAGYNLGPTSITNKITKATSFNDGEIKDWEKAVYNKSPMETRSHMESIKRCMQKGNNSPPLQQGNNRKLEDQRKCTNTYSF